MGRRILLPLVLASLAAPARADEVVMKTGRSIEGAIVHDGADRIVLDVGGGTVSFERHLVSEVRYSQESALQHGRRRAQAARESADPIELWKAADWCERHGVSRQVRPLIERALELDLQDNRTSPVRYLLGLAREGISDKTLKAYVSLFDVRLQLSDDEEERREMHEQGMSLDMLDWLAERTARAARPKPAPKSEAAPPPPPAPAQAPAPAPATEPPPVDPYRNPGPRPDRRTIWASRTIIIAPAWCPYAWPWFGDPSELPVYESLQDVGRYR